jgi:hypothetical protein
MLEADLQRLFDGGPQNPGRTTHSELNQMRSCQQQLGRDQAAVDVDRAAQAVTGLFPPPRLDVHLPHRQGGFVVRAAGVDGS